MEPWRVCRLVVADSHPFAEELDPDPYSSDADPRQAILCQLPFYISVSAYAYGCEFTIVKLLD
jgi:hypothetical protein